MLAAGEGGHLTIGDHGADTHWRVPDHVPHDALQAMRSDLKRIDQRLGNGTSPDWIRVKLGELSTVVAMRQMSDMEARKKLEIMAEELSVYPREVMEAACKRIRREHRWFPELADLIAACDTELEPLKTTRGRIKACLRRATQRQPVRRHWAPPSVEDKEHAAKLTRGLRAQLAEEDERDRLAKRAKGFDTSIPCHRAGLPEGPGSRRARELAEADRKGTDSEASGG